MMTIKAVVDGSRFKVVDEIIGEEFYRVEFGGELFDILITNVEEDGRHVSACVANALFDGHGAGVWKAWDIEYA